MLGTKAVNVMWALLALVFLLIGVQHGKNLGDLKAVEEYERGFNDGKKYALYHRPVIDELEMVCVGLWTATLPEQK
jgi:hydrogenase/urease accessory protein HupE